MSSSSARARAVEPAPERCSEFVSFPTTPLRGGIESGLSAPADPPRAGPTRGGVPWASQPDPPNAEVIGRVLVFSWLFV